MKLAIALTALLVSRGCISNVPVSSEIPAPPNSTCPQVLRFTTHPHVIHPGEEVLLSWNVRNAPDVTLEQSAEAMKTLKRGEYLQVVGKFPPNGTLRVTPKSTTTYVISSGDALIGCVSASVSVVVKPAN